VRRDRGSAVLEFALVAPLLLAVTAGLLQVVLAMHVRATLTSAAAEGARAASLAGADPAAGVRRVRTLLDAGLAGSVVRDITAGPTEVGGLPVMAVRIEAVLPLIGLLGPQALTVEGHAVREGWQ